MLTDKSEEVEMDKEMKRFITAYKHGIVSKEQLFDKYPELTILLEDVKEEISQDFQRQFENLSLALKNTATNMKKDIESVRHTAIEAKKEAKQVKVFLKEYWPFILSILQGALEYKQLLLDAPYVRYVSTSFTISSLIEREISKTFGRPKGKIGTLSYYLFLLFFTGIIASYLQSLDWCLFYGKELYPILQIRIKTMMTETFTKLISEAQVQMQKLGSEKVGIGIALGKNGIEKMKGVFTSLMIVASSYHMSKMSADEIEVKTDDIDSEIVDKYQEIKPKFKLLDNTISPTILMTSGELAKLTERFTKIELLATEVSTYVSNPSSLLNINESISLITRIKNELENPDVNIASRVFKEIQGKMLSINKDVAKHVDYRSLSIAAESIDNNIASNIRLINSDIDYALSKIGETWETRTLFIPKGPQINTLITPTPTNPEMFVPDIALHAIDYMVVFFVLIFPFLTFLGRQTKKAYKKIKGSNNLSIEVLEQRLRY